MSTIERVKEPEVDKDFAVRMKQACDSNNKIPGEKGGRLVWLRDALKVEGVPVALQTVHRWYHGLARPRNTKMLALAKVMEADEGWLSLGKHDDVSGKKRSRQSHHVSDGAVNVVVGFMQMASVQCAWPESDDKDGDFVDFYAIIRGKQHRFHVVNVSEFADRSRIVMRLPVEYQRCTIIVINTVSVGSADIWHMPTSDITDLIEKMGGFAEVVGSIKGSSLRVGDHKFQAISTFATAF